MIAGAASPSITLSLSAVIVAVTEEVPRVLVARRVRHDLATPSQQGAAAEHASDSPDTLPYGPFLPDQHRSLELGLRQWVEEQTGLDLRYVEQLYTFGNQYRDPRELYGGPRVVSVAYLALTREDAVAGSGEAAWQDWYGFLPWEDWRRGRPALIDDVIRPRLDGWIASAETPDQRSARAERASIAFGLRGAAGFDPVRSLDRYELLYGAGLVPEAQRDAAERCRAAGLAEPPMPSDPPLPLGAPMAVDNRRILASALGRLRGKLAYRPVIFDLVPPTFTLLQLQQVVEALYGTCLHKQNFRRTVMSMEMVEPTGQVESMGRGRPAELYRLRREVLRKRRAVGLAVPLNRTTD